MPCGHVVLLWHGYVRLGTAGIDPEECHSRIDYNVDGLYRKGVAGKYRKEA